MDTTNHAAGHRQRLRDRFRKAPDLLADYEVLELLLGYAIPRRDTKPLAKNMLEHFGSVAGIMSARPADLERMDGVGSGVATFLSLLQECRCRELRGFVRDREVFSCPDEVARFAAARLAHSAVEEFWTILVDNRNRFMDFVRISRGTVDQAPVYPREILALVLERQAGGVILVHNHPGGNLQPSKQDDDLTAKIQDAASKLDIRILDHIIVSDSGYYSYREQGRMP
ncbi:MAG: DNA repair protein RadC [Deltaproteobacteria bacterium]|nr:DNA repair protein RadC [Deltaproteobacteria bacterium]